MADKLLLKIFFFRRGGMVLVMALWVLSILSVFAVFIGVGVRQKLVLASRLEKRNAVHDVAKSGVQRARSIFLNMPDDLASRETIANKKFKHHHPAMFRQIPVGDGMVDISYLNYDYGPSDGEVMYGLEDEAGKLNVNTASLDELRSLFMLTAGLHFDEAQDLAMALIDWREPAEQDLVGFYGDEYYANLNFPYEPKGAPLEILEEVLLVKGMNPDVFGRVRDFLTVVGDGKVNLNTASRPVLLALGMSPEVVDTVIYGRHGPDLLAATDDDYIFVDSGASLYLADFFPLSAEQLAQIDQLYVQKKITTHSRFFRAKAKAVLADGKEARRIDAVFSSDDGTIVSWSEY